MKSLLFAAILFGTVVVQAQVLAPGHWVDGIASNSGLQGTIHDGPKLGGAQDSWSDFRFSAAGMVSASLFANSSEGYLEVSASASGWGSSPCSGSAKTLAGLYDPTSYQAIAIHLNPNKRYDAELPIGITTRSTAGEAGSLAMLRLKVRVLKINSNFSTTVLSESVFQHGLGDTTVFAPAKGLSPKDTIALEVTAEAYAWYSAQMQPFTQWYTGGATADYDVEVLTPTFKESKVANPARKGKGLEP